MSRVASLLVALALAAPAAHAQPRSEDARDRGRRGALAEAALRAEPISFALDVPYAGTEDPRQRLDLYLPKERRAQKLPVIVFVHGGGWMHGNKSSGARLLLPYVRTGEYAGVSVGYRLSGEATWPAQIHDAKAAIRWVRANAAAHGLDPDRIGVFGRSAGGHLALLLGVAGDVPELEGALGPHEGVSSAVSCVVNYFGVTEPLAIIGQESDIDRTRADAPEARLLGGPLRENEEKAKAAAPTTYVSPNDPPVLTLHGTADRTVPYDQAVRLDAALRAAGVPSYLVTIEGAGHGDFPPAADERAAAFFARCLLGKDAVVSTGAIDATER